MQKQTATILFSVLLIALGAIFLLNNLDMLPFELNANTVFWAVAFGLGGAAFVATFFSNPREMWWAAIPGFTLLGLAGVIALPSAWSDVGGAVFLGMIGLSFLIIYFIRRDFWWALIPGGVLVTLACVTLASNLPNEGTLSGAVFFLGLAATFLVIYFLPTPDGRMTWAIWPSGVLGVIGLLLMTGAGGMAAYIFPLALVGLGGALVFRALRK